MEQWRDIPGYEGLYSVSDLGRVRRDRDGAPTGRHGGHGIHARAGVIRTGFIGPHGYRIISLRASSGGSSNTCRMHKLVARAFLGITPDGYQVNHKNGDRADSRLDNLEYVTASENVAHSHRMSTAPRRWKQLGADKAQSIRRLIDSGYSTSDVSWLFGISLSGVSRVRRGAAWVSREESHA